VPPCCRHQSLVGGAARLSVCLLGQARQGPAVARALKGLQIPTIGGHGDGHMVVEGGAGEVREVQVAVAGDLVLVEEMGRIWPRC
jgi:hypothetical protein